MDITAALYNDLMDRFIQHTEDEVAWSTDKKFTLSSGNYGHDITEVITMKKEHESVVSQLANHEPVVQVVQEASRRLINISKHDVPEIERRLELHDQAWIELQQLAATRGQKLDESLAYYKFIAEVEEEERWIADNQRLLSLEDCGKTMADVQSLLQKHDAFPTDFAAHVDRCSKIAETGAALASAGNHWAEAICQRCRELQHLLQQLAGLKACLKDNTNYIHFVAFAKAIECKIDSKLSQVRSAEFGSDLSSAQELLDQQNTFNDSLHCIKNNEMIEIGNLYESLVETGNKHGNATRARYHSLKYSWIRLVQYTQARKDTLEWTRDRFEQIDRNHRNFANAASTFKKWLDNTKKQLIDPVSYDSPETLRDWRASLDQLQSDKPRLEDFCQKLWAIDRELKRSNAAPNPYCSLSMTFIDDAWENLKILFEERKLELAREEEAAAQLKKDECKKIFESSSSSSSLSYPRERENLSESKFEKSMDKEENEETRDVKLIKSALVKRPVGSEAAINGPNHDFVQEPTPPSRVPAKQVQQHVASTPSTSGAKLCRDVGTETSYDNNHRNTLIANMEVTYRTCFGTNIKTHFYTRMRTYLKLKGENDYRQQNEKLKKLLTENDTTDFPDLETDGLLLDGAYFETRSEDDHRAKCFVVSPVFTFGVKNVDYTTGAVHELLRKLRPQRTPTSLPSMTREPEDVLKMWLSVFRIESVCEKKGQEFFLYRVTTDGVSASIHYRKEGESNATAEEEEEELDVPEDETKWEKIIRQDKKKLEQLKKKGWTFNRLIGIDPGLRIALAIYEMKVENMEQIDANFAQDRWAHNEFRIKSDKYHFMAGYRRRGTIQKKLTDPLDNYQNEVIANDFPNINLKLNSNPAYATRYRLTLFELRQSTMEKRVIRRLRFDKFIFTERVVAKMVYHIIFGDAKTKEERRETKTFIALGQCSINKRMRGYVRAPLKKIERKLREIARQLPQNVFISDAKEYNTTKLCSVCNEVLFVSRNGHRFLWCQPCNKTFNRDTSAAKNILLTTLISRDLIATNVIPAYDNFSIQMPRRPDWL